MEKLASWYRIRVLSISNILSEFNKWLHPSMVTRRTLLAALAGVPLLSSVISGVGAAPNDSDWENFRSGGPNTGYNPDANGPRVDVTEAWSERAAEGGAHRYQTPIVVDDVVYVGGGYTSPRVVAFDAETGGERWRWAATEDNYRTLYSGVTYADNAVFLKTDDDEFIALNATDGSERWRVSERVLFDDFNPPATDGELVFFDTSKHLFAYSSVDGSEEWRIEKSRPARHPMAVHDGILYYADGRSLHAVATDDGSEKWIYNRPVDGAPVVTDSLVAVPAGDSVQLIDAETGVGEWQFEDGGSIEAPPAIAKDTMYVCDDSALYAVDLDSKSTVWETELDLRDDTYGPVTDGDTVYVHVDLRPGSDETVAIDAETGEERWRYEETGRGTVLGSDKLYINDSRLLALEQPPQPPTANFSYSPTDPKQGDVVEFDASDSYVEGAEIVSYDWDFGDTGTTEAKGEQMEYEVTEAGTLPVRLEVTSDKGETDSLRRVLNVEPRFDDPVASFTISPEDPVAGDTVVFDATDSTPSENLTAFEWRVSGDASLDDRGDRVTYSLDAGSYDVRLRIVDREGREDEQTQSFAVEDSDQVSESSADDGSDSDDGLDADDTSDANDGPDGEGEPTQDDEDAAGDAETSGDADGSADDEAPGFGVVGTLSAIGGVGYFLRRQFTDDDPDDSADYSSN